MSSAEPLVEVILHAIDHVDPFPERRFCLASTIPIGRSSKNTAKRELMSASSNAFFDSPVISREHAILSANTSTGIPKVYITDAGSMHGTRVNGELLESNKPKRLDNGDILQFGVDVVRNESQFKARKYRFESQIPPPEPEPAFPRGFSVPDMASSDEDDVTDNVFNTSSPVPPPRYGSQSNPVAIDDFEDMPPEVIDLDQEPTADPNVTTPQDTSNARPESPAPDTKASDEPSDASNQAVYSFVEDDSSDNEMEQSDIHDSEDEYSEPHSSEAEVDYPEEESTSDHSSMRTSDVEPVSESEHDIDAESEEEDLDAVRRLKMEAMLNHEHEKAAIESQSSTRVEEPTSNKATAALPSPPMAPASRLPEPPMFFTTSASVNFSRDEVKEPEASTSANNMTSPNIFPDTYGNNIWDIPPLPPRPTAPKPPSWGVPGADFNNPFATRSETNNSVWYDEQPPANLFMPPADFFSRPPAPVNVNLFKSRPFLEVSHPTTEEYSAARKMDEFPPDGFNSMPMGASVPTPPMPPSDDINITPQPNRRTKVSIPEIVEDAPQQPPTPTSVASHKRKADVLDEDDSAVVGVPKANKQAATTPPTTPIPQPEQPPRKKLRAVGGFAKTAVASVFAGGLLAFGALMALPDEFFQT